jgi:hypothetical protein
MGTLGVDPVLVEDVNVVSAQPAHRGVDDFPDMGGPTVEADGFTVLVDVEPEFGGHQNVVADRRQRFADELLVDVGAVSLGGVEQGDAAFGGVPDHGQRFRPFRGCAEAEAQSHAAEADC